MKKELFKKVSGLCIDKEINFKCNDSVFTIKNICSISFFNDSIEIITNRYHKDFRFHNDKANLNTLLKIINDVVLYG